MVYPEFFGLLFAGKARSIALVLGCSHGHRLRRPWSDEWGGADKAADRVSERMEIEGFRKAGGETQGLLEVSGFSRANCAAHGNDWQGGPASMQSGNEGCSRHLRQLKRGDDKIDGVGIGEDERFGSVLRGDNGMAEGSEGLGQEAEEGGVVIDE